MTAEPYEVTSRPGRLEPVGVALVGLAGQAVAAARRLGEDEREAWPLSDASAVSKTPRAAGSR